MESLDRHLERLASDEGHCVERPILVLAQAMDRYDAGVLKLGGDHGLAEEPPARDLVDLSRENALQSDGPVKLLLPCDENLSQAALGVEPGLDQVGDRPEAIGRVRATADCLTRARRTDGRRIVALHEPGPDRGLIRRHRCDPLGQLIGQIGRIARQLCGRERLSLRRSRFQRSRSSSMRVSVALCSILSSDIDPTPGREFHQARGWTSRCFPME